jgi:hypothetical protein
MKLRLRIAASPDFSTAFEHAGPVIRIGRDPACELILEGEASRSVSWQHARIELAAQGATLTDAGSRNGTLLNDRPVQKTMPLGVGDRIQLGYTGPTLTVLELDLGAPLPAGPAVPSRRSLVIGLGAGLAVVGIVAAALLLFGPKGEPAPDGASPGQSAQNSPPKQPAGQSAQDKPRRQPPEPTTQQPVVKPGPRREEGGKEAPSAEMREIGRYVSFPRWPPSVLLQRQGESYPWTPLRPEDKVSTVTTLVSLPGYRSLVALDSGVHLTLWGNLPEFSGFPPVLESVVMLNQPGSGMDLDLTLDRGRVHIASRKPKGPTRVRLRFLREVWDLTLLDTRSEVGVELWSLPPQGQAGEGRRPAPACLGLFTKGRIRLQWASWNGEVPDRSRVTWVSRAAGPLRPEALPRLPDWWTKPPDTAAPQVADALLTLKDWSGILARSTEVMDAILTRVHESRDATQRVLGLLFLAALDGAPYLVEFLEDRKNPEVRGTAAHALRAWLGRDGDRRAELARILQEKRGYSREKAALILRLLHRFSREDLARPETYQTLIGYLDHENLAVRDLAYWHLALLVPEGARKIRYDPVADPENRQQSIRRWKKLVPEGKVPAL